MISVLSNVSISECKYLEDLDYYEDTMSNCRKFTSNIPIFHKGFSYDDAMRDIIRSRKWDLIYIDGNHDYEVAQKDYDICSKNLRKGGLLVLDDAALYTPYKPAIYSSRGHPGPSQMSIRPRNSW